MRRRVLTGAATSHGLAEGLRAHNWNREKAHAPQDVPRSVTALWADVKTTMPRQFQQKKIGARVRRWVVMVLVAVFALGGLLHAGQVQAASAHGGDPSEVTASHGDGTPGNRALGEHTPANHLPAQTHDAQFASCASTGNCLLCGPTPIRAATAPRTCRPTAPDFAVAVVSRAIAPPLRPPLLHG